MLKRDDPRALYIICAAILAQVIKDATAVGIRRRKLLDQERDFLKGYRSIKTAIELTRFVYSEDFAEQADIVGVNEDFFRSRMFRLMGGDVHDAMPVD